MFFLKHQFLGKSEMSFSFDWDRSWNSAKTDQSEMDSFLEKRNPDQKWPEIETYKFAQNVCCERCSATMKYEIIWKPMVLKRVEVNLNLHITTRSRICL